VNAFTSNLSVDEHHAIRSVGFTPVGQVMGSCVYSFSQYAWYCDVRIREVKALSEPGSEARRLAVRRMRDDCAGLGGDGVVAVTLTVREFSAGGLEFVAIGTAVRADGPVRARTPFVSGLTGQDFAKLVSAGWLPCGFVLGLAVVVRHDDHPAGAAGEDKGRTTLVEVARRTARKRLRADAALCGGQGVVLRKARLRAWHQECRNGPKYGVREPQDCMVEAVLTGTAIVRFRTVDPPSPRLVLGLDV